MRRAAGWLLILAGVCACGAALVTMPVVTWWLLGAGLVAFVVGCAIEPLPRDLLADHPADELEERRRRGAAGWQKPVSPPPPRSRPGGLPPARRRHGGEDPVHRRSG